MLSVSKYIFGSFEGAYLLDPELKHFDIPQNVLELSADLMNVYREFIKTGYMSWNAFDSQTETVAIYNLDSYITEANFFNTEVCSIMENLTNNQRYDRFEGNYENFLSLLQFA